MGTVTRNVPDIHTDDRITADFECGPRDQRRVALAVGTVDRRGEPDVAPTVCTPAAGTVVSDSVDVDTTLSDVEIRLRIVQTITCLSQLDSKHIQVNVDRHVVTLLGQVRCWSERQMVEQVAWASPAISAVHNQLAVPY